MHHRSRGTLFPQSAPLEKAGSTARRRTPFVLLTLHFFRQAMALSSEDGEPGGFGAAGLFALLAVPGILYSFLLFQKYSTFLRFLRGGPINLNVYAASYPDKYYLIVCSMSLTVLLVVLRWSHILPGRTDYAVMTPLPIRRRTIFLANVTALGLLAVLVAIDLNAVSTVLFPLVVLSDENAGLLENVRFGLVHGLCVSLASAFAFFACLALLGTLLPVLGRATFQRVSLPIRVGLVAVSFLLFWTGFHIPSPLRPHSQSGLHWLPPVWYVALYQYLQGETVPDWHALANRGLQAFVTAALLAVVMLGVSYRRSFLRMSEIAAGRSSGGGWLGWGRKTFDRVCLNSGFERAMYWFSLRLLARSEQHFLALGSLVVLGLLIATAEIFAAPSPQVAGVITGSLSLAYLLVVGLRVAVELPGGPRAAWIYRVCLDSVDARPVLRKIAVSLLLVIVITPTAVLQYSVWNLRVALCHALFSSVFSIVLVDWLFVTFRRMPFTRQASSFENRSVLVVALLTVGFLAFTSVGTRVELALLHRRAVWFLAVPLLLPLSWMVRRMVDREQQTEGMALALEEGGDREFVTLDLSG